MSKKMVFEVDEECPSCDGTGLYVGMAEQSGAAVVCHDCRGTGCYHFRRSYKPFVKRRLRSGITRVLEANPGICVGADATSEFSLEDFGGIPYKDWKSGKTFGSGTEMRRFTCPCWWYQSTDSSKKPRWETCLRSFGRRFGECDYFLSKDECWKRWDAEFGT